MFRTSWATAAGLAALLAMAGLYAAAVADGPPAGEQPKPKPDSEDKNLAFAAMLWKNLQRVDYRESFSPWPGMPDEFFPGTSPHGAYLKMYVNQRVANHPEKPPHRSIIIKENYSPDKKLVAVTVMYRMKMGYDMQNQNWFWVKYTPEGRVPKMNGKPLAGKVGSCISCHASAADGDYLFVNDPPDPPEENR